MKPKALLLGLAASSLILAGCGGTNASSSSEEADASTSQQSSSSESSSSSSIASGEENWADTYDLKTIAELKTLAAGLSEPSAERYYVAATIDKVTNPSFGEMVISDETGTLDVYGTYSADGEKRYSELDEKPVAGDKVLLYGNLQEFKGEAEIYSGWIIDFVHVAPSIDPDDYELSTLEEAHAAKEGTTLKVTGTVLTFTYNASQSPIGMMIGDATGTMYLYDSQLAPQLKLNDTITVVATKDYWVLDSEATTAEKLGYAGANQLTNATLVSKTENGTFDYDAVAEATSIKGIIDTPFTEDITGTLYKVPAQIVKQAGSGFTNYYFNDLDGETGSYVYTQANGNDFSWLDQYDQQLHYVYLVALNAKMSSSGGIWRFLPIKVDEATYSFDLKNVPSFVLDYYAMDQFETSYMADPSLELLTSVDNTVIPFTGATISYSSSEPTRVSIDEENGKTVLHAHIENPGTAEITVTAHYAGAEDVSKKVTISVEDPTEIQALTVKEAIEAEVSDEQILVRGIVGPSCVNQPAFYLIDETGAVAVRMADKNLFDGTFEIGDEVIVQGTRDMWGSNGKQTQIVLSNAVIYRNLFGGDGTYPTASFISGKTLADLAAMPTDETAHTAEVYVLEDVTISAVIEEKFSRYDLVQGDTKMQLYSSSGSQYDSLLKNYANQTVDMELALCNWNSKTSFKGCVLSVTDSEGVKTYNTLNFAN